MAVTDKHGSPKHGAEAPFSQERTAPITIENEAMADERKEIISWLESVRFRRRLFGGVDEKDVWKKIAELDILYTKALEAERVRYDVLIAEAKKKAAVKETVEPDTIENTRIPRPGSETGGGTIG